MEKLKLTGVFWLLKNKESDVVILYAGPVAFEVITAIICTYEFQDHDNLPGILVTFRAFSIHVYALIVIVEVLSTDYHLTDFSVDRDSYLSEN